jgi:hypothetical protein
MEAIQPLCKRFSLCATDPARKAAYSQKQEPTILIWDDKMSLAVGRSAGRAVITS